MREKRQWWEEQERALKYRDVTNDQLIFRKQIYRPEKTVNTLPKN